MIKGLCGYSFRMFMVVLLVICTFTPLIASPKKSRFIEVHIVDADTKRPVMASVQIAVCTDSIHKQYKIVGSELIGVGGVSQVRLRAPIQAGKRYRVLTIPVSKYTYVAGEKKPTFARYYHVSYDFYNIPDDFEDPVVFPVIEVKRLTSEELAIAKAYNKKRTIYDDYGDEEADDSEVEGTGKMLNEVTVSATKIEFYQKGDTLIYNADAFKLGEGATLDALLAKMPGIELRSGGVIYCNGRRLERLLINGRNLFNGRNELMLENIAAYTIKDIAVYDKRGRISELMGRNTGDSNYVMDVRLKREYSMGGTLNAEAGYGTKNRYTGKLFGMWYSDFVALNAYGNMNNLSNDKMPGAKDDFTVEDIHNRPGEMTTKAGGLSYNAKQFRGQWELSGSVDVTNRNVIDRRQSQQESFYQAGNIFDYSWADANRRDFSVATQHNFFTKLGSRAILEIKPSYSFGNERRSSNSVSGQFRREMEGLTAGNIEDSFKSRAEEQTEADSAAINRRVNEAASFKKVHRAKLAVSSNIKVFDIGAQPSMLTVGASGDYSGNRGDSFQRYRYNFGDPEQAPLLSHLYHRNRPDDRKAVSAWAGLTTFLDFLRIFIPVNYTFDHEEIKHHSSAYLLSSLNDYDAIEWPLDSVPPADVYQPVIDPSQGYESREVITSHRIDAFMNQSMAYFPKPDSRYGFSVVPSASVTFKHSSYEYFTNGEQQQINRTTALPRLSLAFGVERRQSWKHSIGADWSLSDSPLYQFVNRPSDGLTHYIGNNEVKNSGQLTLRYSYYLRKPRIQHDVDARYIRRTNSLVLTSAFDRQTGETFWMPRYAGGNFDIIASYRLFSYLDRDRRWSISSKTQLRMDRTSDFSTSFNSGDANLTAETAQYSIHRYTAEENLRISWRKGVADLSAFADVKFNRYTGERDNFIPFNSQIYNYGATATLSLPKGWSVQTDMTVYTRRGFLDSRANTTDFVWNARLAKSILSGSLTFIIDGYDILNQLSNITYTVNAQARTVVTTNVLPSYFLMRVVYRFHRGPKVQVQQLDRGTTINL